MLENEKKEEATKDAKTTATSFRFILYEPEARSNHVKITINRPEVMNALNLQVRQEILAALDLAENDEAIRSVVLTGAGERAFSAGADLKMFLSMTPFDAKEYLKVSKGASIRLENFPKPVIAAVNGYAMGGGLELAMSCDIIIASDNARFAQSEINVGLIPGVGGTQRLPRIVGLKRAKEMVFTGGMIDAQEALRIGLVNRVVPQKDLAAEVETLVRKISEKSPLILRLAKEALNRSTSSSLHDGLDYESSLFALCFSTRDQKEGAQAFLEKRTPNFSGT